MNEGTRQIRLAAPDCKSAMDERGHVGSNPTVPIPVQNRVERLSIIDTERLPGEVAHFVNTLSTDDQHRIRQRNLQRRSEFPGFVENSHALFLRLFLNYLRTEEGQVWISTLPITDRLATGAGVRASLERVLAVGHIIATIHQEQQCE